MTKATEADELDAIDAALSENWVTQSRLRAEAKSLGERREKIRNDQFVKAFDSGRFVSLDRAAFQELHTLMHSAGQSAYGRGKQILAAIHPAIAYDGGYVGDTKQPIFQVTLAYQESTEGLEEAVRRVSEWVAVEGHPVYWSIFDWRLSEDGVHSMRVHPDGEAEIIVTTYGRDRSEGRKPLSEVLTDIAAHHYYPARDEDRNDW